MRTYTREPDGRDGLWFLSLDTARVPFLLARTLGLSYAWSQMTVERHDRTIEYTARRQLPPAGRPTNRVRIEVGERLAPAELGEQDHFLTGRWHAYHAIGWSAGGHLGRAPAMAAVADLGRRAARRAGDRRASPRARGTAAGPLLPGGGCQGGLPQACPAGRGRRLPPVRPPTRGSLTPAYRGRPDLRGVELRGVLSNPSVQKRLAHAQQMLIVKVDGLGP